MNGTLQLPSVMFSCCGGSAGSHSHSTNGWLAGLQVDGVAGPISTFSTVNRPFEPVGPPVSTAGIDDISREDADLIPHLDAHLQVAVLVDQPVHDVDGLRPPDELIGCTPGVPSSVTRSASRFLGGWPARSPIRKSRPGRVGLAASRGARP